MRTKFYLLLIALLTAVGSVFGQAAVGDTFLYRGFKYEISRIAPNPLEVKVVRNDYPHSTIVIPESVINPNDGESYAVTGVGVTAFGLLENLVSVILPESLKTLDSYAFASSPNLTSVTFPSTLVSIGGGAFNLCKNLKTVTLPEGITTIGNVFFEGSGITSIEIPASVVTISPTAFASCDDLVSITVAGGTSFSVENDVLYTFDKTKIVLYPSGKIDFTDFALPPTVEAIYFTDDYYTTFNNKALERITGGNIASLEIRDGVLYSASGTKTLLFCPMGRIGEFIVPADVEAVSPTAFKNGNLTSIKIHEDVLTIGIAGDEGNVFSYGLNLTEIVVHEDNPNYCTVDGILFDNDKENLLAYPGGKSTPTTYSLDANVVTIGSNAFAGNSYITSFVGSSVLEEIGALAFQDAKSLKTVRSIDAVNIIGQGAFRGSSLESINLPANNPGFTTINAHTFYESNLISIEVPASVETITAGSFGRCFSLENVVLNEGLIFIGGQAFATTAISSLTMPSTVATIADRAFQRCYNLREIIISGSTTLPALTDNDHFYNVHEDFHIVFETADADDIETWLDDNKVKLPFGVDTPLGYFSVTFDYNDGETIRTTVADYRTSLVKEPATPILSEYDFQAWLDADSKVWDFAANTVSEDITLTASWTKTPTPPAPKPQYTVTIEFLAGVTLERKTAGAHPVDEGGSFAFGATANTNGYRVIVYVNGTEHAPTSDNFYLIEGIIEDITVTFALTAGTYNEDSIVGGITINGESLNDKKNDYPTSGKIVITFNDDADTSVSGKVIIDGKEVPGTWGTDSNGNPTYTIDYAVTGDGEHTIKIEGFGGDGETHTFTTGGGSGNNTGGGKVVIDDTTPPVIPGEFPGDGEIVVCPPVVTYPNIPSVTIDGEEVVPGGSWDEDEDGKPIFVIEYEGLEDGEHTIVVNGKEYTFTVKNGGGATSNDVLSTAKITAAYGTVTIETPKTVTVQIVSFSGSVVYNANVVGTVTVNVPAGIYIVAIDGTATKVVVR